MRKKLFYGLVGLAAFFIVFQHVQAIAIDLWDWWDDRNYEYTPTYDSVTATDAVERPVQKIRPNIDGTLVAPLTSSDGEITPRRHIVVPTHLQFATGRINLDALDQIVVTAQKRSNGLPSGLRLPKRSDRPQTDDGEVSQKVLHAVQRSCNGTQYSNLLLHDRDKRITKPVFDVPLSVIGHQLVQTENQISHILAFTAIVDTNQDDKLSCQDFIHMAIFDLNTDRLHWVDMGGSEPLMSLNRRDSGAPILRKMSDTEFVMGVGIDENDDGLFDPQKEITEMAVLNIASKTFDKIVTGKDLKNLQNILYSLDVEE